MPWKSGGGRYLPSHSPHSPHGLQTATAPWIDKAMNIFWILGTICFFTWFCSHWKFNLLWPPSCIEPPAARIGDQDGKYPGANSNKARQPNRRSHSSHLKIQNADVIYDVFNTERQNYLLLHVTWTRIGEVGNIWRRENKQKISFF